VLACTGEQTGGGGGGGGWTMRSGCGWKMEERNPKVVIGCFH